MTIAEWIHTITPGDLIISVCLVLIWNKIDHLIETLEEGCKK